MYVNTIVAQLQKFTIKYLKKIVELSYVVLIVKDFPKFKIISPFGGIAWRNMTPNTELRDI